MGFLIKKDLKQNEIDELSRLLIDYPQLLISSGILSPREYKKYFFNNLSYLLRKDKKNYSIVVKKKEIIGMSMLRYMQWDSNFFKMPIGNIEYILVDKNMSSKEAYALEKGLLNESMNLAKKVGIKLLYLSVNPSRFSLIDSLNSLKFNFICGEMAGVISKKDIPYLKVKGKVDPHYKFRKYGKDDYGHIMRIGGEIAEDLSSKFILTPSLPQKEKKNYYLENIRNCCLGTNADDIFVVEKSGIPVGFVCYRYDRIFKETLGKKIAFLVIGGISRLERRKNAGSFLFSNAHKQILQKSDTILWKVYLHNLSMINFILRRGLDPTFDFIYTFCKKI